MFSYSPSLLGLCKFPNSCSGKSAEVSCSVRWILHLSSCIVLVCWSMSLSRYWTVPVHSSVAKLCGYFAKQIFVLPADQSLVMLHYIIYILPYFRHSFKVPYHLLYWTSVHTVWSIGIFLPTGLRTVRRSVPCLLNSTFCILLLSAKQPLLSKDLSHPWGRDGLLTQLSPYLAAGVISGQETVTAEMMVCSLWLASYGRNLSNILPGCPLYIVLFPPLLEYR